jgi:hypothetical protein
VDANVKERAALTVILTEVRTAMKSYDESDLDEIGQVLLSKGVSLSSACSEQDVEISARANNAPAVFHTLKKEFFEDQIRRQKELDDDLRYVGTDLAVEIASLYHQGTRLVIYLGTINERQTFKDQVASLCRAYKLGEEWDSEAATVERAIMNHLGLPQ